MNLNAISGHQEKLNYCLLTSYVMKISGYYCTLGSADHSPTDGVTGDECPQGYYCPQGSEAGTPCPQGYYLNSTRNTVNTSCIVCNPGKKSSPNHNDHKLDSCQYLF